MTSLFSDIFSADNLQLTEPMVNLIVSLAVNSLVTWIIVHFFYYPKGHRRDYYFTFILLSVSIFMLISLLLQGSSDMGIGAASDSLPSSASSAIAQRVCPSER